MRPAERVLPTRPPHPDERSKEPGTLNVSCAGLMNGNSYSYHTFEFIVQLLINDRFFFSFVIVSIADADRNYKRAIRIDRLPNRDRYCEIP